MKILILLIAFIFIGVILVSGCCCIASSPTELTHQGAESYCQNSNCDKINDPNMKQECYFNRGQSSSGDTSCCLKISDNTTLKDDCLYSGTIGHSAWAVYGGSFDVEDYCKYISNLTKKDDCYNTLGHRLGTNYFDWCSKLSTTEKKDSCYSRANR